VSEAAISIDTIFQVIGIALVAMLSLFLNRSIERVYLRYFAMAWICLAVGLSSLFVCFRFPWTAAWLETGYYLGEYLFGLLLIAGCRNYATGRTLGRRDGFLLLLAVTAAALMPFSSEEFVVRFVVQAAALSAFFALAFLQLEQAHGKSGPGLSITRVALALLSLSFLHYVPVYTHAFVANAELPFVYRAYGSVSDLILEVLLAFGIVILTMEDVRREVELMNRDLRAAHDRLEMLVRLDPLTESLSRHALYTLVEERHRSRGVAPGGCVAAVDVDDLKPINDTYGHAAGDDVIRAVARATRSVVRADDLVFRWGGDEFLVVLFGVAPEDVRSRLEGLEARLLLTRLGDDAVLDVKVSFGVAAFGAETPLERAIEAADEAMYRQKQLRKSQRLESSAAGADSSRN
jgi:diguanylate cyclase (GGDEF)-like protein